MSELAIATPIGFLVGESNEMGLRSLRFSDQPAPEHDGAIGAVLRRYFEGEVEALADLPLDVEGTDFQVLVWAQVATLMPGQVTTYGDIAERIGRPSAVRAVGAAIGRNPLALVIPCHRVVAKSGDLTGYAWGVARKRWLLEHEGAISAAQMRFELNAPSMI